MDTQHQVVKRPREAVIAEYMAEQYKEYSRRVTRIPGQKPYSYDDWYKWIFLYTNRNLS